MPRTTYSSDPSHDFGTPVQAEIEVITESVEDGANKQEWAMARDEAYREAEQRIEAARQAGAMEFDLITGCSNSSERRSVAKTSHSTERKRPWFWRTGARAK
ncbi:MAG TPA: hypothetical protein V6C85_33465 [Allocoleopsis sp.]